MQSRLLCIILFGVIFSILNVSKDLMSLGTIYLKSYACEFKIDDVLKSDSLSEITPSLTEEELKELKNMKRDYCKSAIKFNF